MYKSTVLNKINLTWFVLALTVFTVSLVLPDGLTRQSSGYMK